MKNGFQDTCAQCVPGVNQSQSGLLPDLGLLSSAFFKES